MSRIIVSRHIAAVLWIARQLDTEGVEYVPEGGRGLVGRVRADVDRAFGVAGSVFEVIPIMSSVTEDDVKGMDVIGNIPIDLAAHANLVSPICFPPGKSPRGAEYGLNDMIDAGAYLAGPYHVRTPAQLQAGGYCI